MAGLSYLWANRIKYPFASQGYIRAWAKRILLLPQVFKRNAQRNALNRAGARVHETAEIGEASIIGNKSRLSVGKFSFIGRASMVLHGSINIGDRVCINDGVEILTATHSVTDHAWAQIAKDTVIEDYVWIAQGAMILPGVTLGRGCVVGARAVVSKSVPAGAIVAGNPAVAISKTRSWELDYNPCEFLAANQAWLVPDRSSK
ncbi:acyltransferase [Mucilaginibacter pallidiroseus]|uniref:Acyltransferase n=1 Tax=Mucilaginibacter pallidiroseus TaxID=2599295 RepID=A0A563U8C5_9SPHI|nr:acyltransferase [Mucilaginibacter pallidiroseus]TWR27576.1 acyltransferase [Mucilaginibacter pallidiroseus]